VKTATNEAGARPVVVVDDDPLFRDTLAANLTDAGLAVAVVGGGEEALDYLERGAAPAAMLLDWDMPAMDGLAVLKRLRADGYTTPVLFLTGLTAPIYEERALAEGAVDFVDKSKSFTIILRRLRLVMAGKGSAGSDHDRNPGSVVAGDLEIRADSARAYWRGREVDLSLTEFKVVQALVKRHGRDMSYREIYDLVRGEGFFAGAGEEGYRANVRALVKRIRQKFRDIDGDFAALENYPGFGYRWRDGQPE